MLVYIEGIGCIPDSAHRILLPTLGGQLRDTDESFAYCNGRAGAPIRFT